MGGSLHRERRIVAAVACPICRAARGEVCRLRTEAERATATGRLLVHGARRTAWQEWKRSRPVDIYVRASQILVAQSDAAYAALDQLAPADALREPATRTVRVTSQVSGTLIVALSAEWRVE